MGKEKKNRREENSWMRSVDFWFYKVLVSKMGGDEELSRPSLFLSLVFLYTLPKHDFIYFQIFDDNLFFRMLTKKLADGKMWVKERINGLYG